MKVQELLVLDCRSTSNKLEVQKVLHKIEHLKKVTPSGSEVPLEKIEKLVAKIVRGYDIWPNVSVSFMDEGNDWYMVAVMYNGRSLESIYGYCWYDLWSKLAIYLWAAMKNGKIKKKE